MRMLIALSIVAFLAGLVCGPFALAVASDSVPPIDAESVVFAAIGSLVAIALVVGVQALHKRPRTFRVAWHVFAFVAIFTVASGLSAVATALLGPGLHAHSFLFLAVGVAMAIALAGLRLGIPSMFRADI